MKRPEAMPEVIDTVVLPVSAPRQDAPGSIRSRPGGMVVSLDFELYWGVRDQVRLDRDEKARLLVARAVVPRILDLFEEFRIHATWATVGLLFAGSKEEADEFRPAVEPGYIDQRLNPYREPLGASEEQDPYHFAPSLIAAIASRPGQEIASHSFSHYYCMEPGQTAEEFEADLQSAVAIAERSGYHLKSYVFPRNQANAGYLPILHRHGVKTFRGNEPASAKGPDAFAKQRAPRKRAIRLADAYLNIHGDQTASWPDSQTPVDLRASRYLRPATPVLRLLEPWLIGRIQQQLRAAAEKGRVFHLWWHPEDFAANPDGSLSVLRRVLALFDSYRRRYGIESLSMLESSAFAQ
jgi:peptidoglycan/xylan/chitin deacetylase (PgdA/CDA1 family)